MLVSEKLAIAAHLHVLLRRKTGRVTDTEWMAVNLEYATEVVRFARAKALTEGHADLIEWADKLERAARTPTQGSARVPLVQQAAQLMQKPKAEVPPPPATVAEPQASEFGASGFAATGFAESGFSGDRSRKPKEPDAPRYVGGIR